MKRNLQTALKNRLFRRCAGPIAGALAIYFAFFTHVEPTERGIARNWVTGELRLLEPGWHVSSPWTWVAMVDIRPMRVSVQSAGRGFSAKLVQFDVAGWREFVQTEGWRYYWWANRISFNAGHAEEHRGMKDILRGYAYGHRPYPFVKIIEEYGSETRPDSIAAREAVGAFLYPVAWPIL